MATRTSRRLGTRLILGAALLALAAASLPAHAVITPSLVGSSVQSGYAANTILLPDHVGVGAARPFDPNDPPYQQADGEVRSVASRWGVTLCTTSTATLTGALGAIAGTTSLEAFKKAPDKVIRFTVDTTARPHGLTAGDSPLTITWNAIALQPNGTCAGATSVSETFALDRTIPDAPNLETPAALGSMDFCDPFSIEPPDGGTACETATTAEPQTGDVIVSGTASDPLTFPFEEQPDDKYTETSGVKAVVVRLSTGMFCGYLFCGDTFEESFSTEIACTGSSPLSLSIQRCEDTAAFSVTIPAETFIPGAWYAVDAYAIDVAGFRSSVASNQPTNSDNQNGTESNSVSFLYTG